MTRIAGTPFIAMAIANDMKFAAVGGCILAVSSDWLDGYIARKYNQSTLFGSYLDPFADKLFVGSIALGLAIKGLFPMPLAALIIARDIGLVGTAFYIRARDRKPGDNFFNTSYEATAHVQPTTFSKANTAIQFGLLTLTLGNFAFGVPLLDNLEPLWWITAATTVGSGLGYLNGNGLKKSNPNSK